MKIAFDLQAEIDSRIRTVFGDRVNTEKLSIELSNDYPKNFDEYYFNWVNHQKSNPIEGFLAEYLIENDKVILYLPVISETSKIAVYPFKHFIRIILYFEIGQWICYNYNNVNLSFSNVSFTKTGTFFRNFTSLMICFELIKDDPDLVRCFNNTVVSLSKENTLCLKFIEIRREGKMYLPGIKLNDVLMLIGFVIKTGETDISNDFLMEYFDSYLSSNIIDNPQTLYYFQNTMTERQKEKWKHLSKEYGFFDQ